VTVSVSHPALKKVKTAVHQFCTKCKSLFSVCTTTYSDLIRLALCYINISFSALSGSTVITILVTDSTGELTAKKDQSLSGSDIRFLVPFWPEPEPEPDIKKWPDIRFGQPEPERGIREIFPIIIGTQVIVSSFLG